MCIRDRYQRRVHGESNQITTGDNNRNQMTKRVVLPILAICLCALTLNFKSTNWSNSTSHHHERNSTIGSNGSNSSNGSNGSNSSNFTQNCTHNANDVIFTLLHNDSLSIYYNSSAFFSVVDNVLNSSCINYINYEYCNVTLNTTRLLVSNLSSSAYYDWWGFKNLYPAVKYNLLNWTASCAQAYPRPVRTTSTPRLNGSNYCASKTSTILQKVTSLLNMGWFPIVAEDINFDLNQISANESCFNMSETCLDIQWAVQTFYNATQNQTSFRAWNSSLVQYLSLIHI
eukprot:TRINITY_DN26952_c0_g2_i1.p1 TRINITY_DN26952_c0_g2~~TRINITY_DN26952_c0_g2_i1.p1  ORF type:complete len:316 (+),score=83.06 TRINITY_DN26952_c0_g2_i1:92-949(+)